MAVKRKYRLNLRNYGNLPAIMLSQYDEGYALEFEIRDGTDAASDLSAYTVTLKGTRADTLAYSFAGTVSINVLTFVIDTTMTACAGKGTAEIAIKDTANDVLFATFNMPVFVERAAVPEGSIDADVERAQEIAEEVEELIDGATEGAEAWAVGQRGGVDVESTDETYHNNAKYYAEQAADSAASIGIDATLTQAGKAADAKKTGDEINALKEEFTAVSKVINLIDESQCIDDKYYDPNTGTITNGNHTTQLLPLIPVSTGNYYFYTNFTGSQFFSAVVFNADKSYSRLISTADIRFSSPIVTISGNEAYVGITLYNTQLGGKTAFVEEKYKGYFVGLQNSANVIPPHTVVDDKFVGNTIVVDKNGNGDYTTITDAVASITNDSATNPYTIIIRPGVYKEVVAIRGGRHISLIGENMKDCILRDDTGLYENCPLQIGGDFLVENLTVIATHDDNPSMPHTGNKAYAIHIDYAGEGVGIVRNCKLVSHQSSAIGAGTHQDQTIIIDNCELISYTPNGSTWDPSSDWTTTPSYGALFVHSETKSNVTGQVLTVKNCMITSANKRNCAFSNSPDGTSNMEINLINNNLWCADGNADSTITEWYSPVYSGRSYGNNVAKLNA